MDDSNEVQELLSRSYATPDYIDDADLEAGNPGLRIIFLFLFFFNYLELEMLGTESFEMEEERPSYLDDLVTPSTNKIKNNKIGELDELQ